MSRWLCTGADRRFNLGETAIGLFAQTPERSNLIACLSRADVVLFASNQEPDVLVELT